ncbi:response regulator transcription factor [Lentzea xinjiangensis]|nr:helix-turn-helix transcriptional regulator [Lentzea xinjiangensis]
MKELIRQARIHQEIAQDLLAKAEEISSAKPDNDSSAEHLVRTRWKFTGRERQVAGLLIGGLSNRRIARSLTISERTVKNHLHSIFCKMGVSDRTQAVIKLMRAS